MNKTMILAIPVAYEAFNDKSLTIAVNEHNCEHVLDDVTIGNINSDIDYEDILDNLDDYEYPYNHVNRCDL